MTNPALAAIDDAMHAAFLADGMADEGSYRFGGEGDPRPVRVLVDRAVDVFGFDSQVATPTTTVRVWLADLDAVPRRGDTVTIGDERFVIDRIMERDESTCMCSVASDAGA